MKKQAQNKQASVFKPLIATSLALALGVSVASAAGQAGKPQLTINSGSDQSSALGIVWNGLNGGDLLNQPAQTGGSDPFTELKFVFDSNTGSSASNSFSGSINTITVGGGTQQSIVLGKTTSGIQINDGTGTLSIDFGSAKVGNNFILDLSDVSPSSGAYAFKGHITTSGTNYDGNRYFKAIFGASVKGDITLNSGGNSTGSNAITFKSGANLEGNLTVGYEDTSIVFEQGRITENVKKTSSGVLNITFNSNGGIDGEIFSDYSGTTNIGGANLTLNGDIIVENKVENGLSYYGGANNIVFSGTNGTIGNDGTSGQTKKKVNLTVATNKNGAYPNVSGHNAIIANATNNTFTLGNISLGGSYADGRSVRTHNIISLNTTATTNILTADSLSSSFGYTFIGKNIVILDSGNNNAITYNQALFDSPTSRDPVVKNNINTLFMDDAYMAEGNFTIGEGSGNVVLAGQGGYNYLNIKNLTISGNLEVNGSGSSNNINAGTLAISGNISAIISGHSASNYNIISSGSLTLNNPISITASGNDVLNADTKNLIDISGTTTANGNLSILAHSAADGYKSIALQNIIKFGGNVTFSGTNKITSLIARGKDPRSVDITYNVLSFDGSGAQTLTIDSINAKSDLEGYYGGNNYIGKGFTAGSKNTLTLNSDLFNEKGVGGKFWNDSTHQANLTLTVTNPLYAKNGSNYINVTSLSATDVSSISGGGNYLSATTLTISGNVNESNSTNTIKASNLTINGEVKTVLGQNHIYSSTTAQLGDIIAINTPGTNGGRNYIVMEGTSSAIGEQDNKATISVNMMSNGSSYYDLGSNTIVASATTNTLTLDTLSLCGSYGGNVEPEKRIFNILSFNNANSTNTTLTADSVSSAFGLTIIGKDIASKTGYSTNLFDEITEKYPIIKDDFRTIFMRDTYTAKGTYTFGTGSNDAIVSNQSGINYLNVETLEVNGNIKAVTTNTNNSIYTNNLTVSGIIESHISSNYIISTATATVQDIYTHNNQWHSGGVNYIVFNGTEAKVGDSAKANITVDMSVGGNYDVYGHNVIIANAATNTFNLEQLRLSGAYGAGQPAKTHNILSFNQDNPTSTTLNADSIISGFGNTIIGKNIALNTGLSDTLFDNTTKRDPSIKANFATTFMSDTYTAKGTFTIGTGSGNAITAGEGAGNYLNVESLIINGAVKTTSNGVNYLYANKKLTISNGVSGTNSITLKAGDTTQTASVIKNIVSDEQNTLTLGTAVSGTSNLDLNVSASSLGAGVTAIESYIQAISSGADLTAQKNAILNASVIAGNIVSSGNTNIKITGTENTTTKTPTNKAQIGILGNINNNNGVVFNAIMQDAFFAPTEFLVNDSGTYRPVSFGGTQAGTITTGANATTNIITRFTNPVVNSSGISMYGLDVGKNSTTNIAIQGNINVGTYIDYEQGSTINLIFANANNMTSDSASDSFEKDQNNLAGNGSQLLGVTYQDGVKLAMADKTVLIGDSYASFLDTYSSYYTDGDKPLATVWAERTAQVDTVGIQGLVVGDIYSLDSSGAGVISKTYNVTLESGSAFAGKIKLDSNKTTAINIVMKNNSKLILSDTRDGTATDTFVINSLEIQGGVVDSYQLQMETLKQTNNVINLASGGASANNVATRENFRLLAIGDATGINTPATSGGLSGDGKAVFMTYVNTNADQNKATLGKVASSGKKSARAGGATSNGQYGNIYSDRIIIANIGNNQTAKSGDYYMQFAVDAKSKLGSVVYDASNDTAGGQGGVKTAGNIAVLTVVNTDDRKNSADPTYGKAGINLKTQDVLQGFDRIGGDLIAVQTDINGVYDDNGGYTTYFINHLNTRGATEATQEATASAFATNYDLYLANFNSLNKRMGELRDNTNSQGAWARVFSGAQSNDFSKSKSTYTTIQGGYDYALGFEGANNYIGLAVSYSMSSSKSDLNAIDINGSAKGIEDIKSSAVEVAVYNSYVQDEGWYNDTIAKFSYIMSDFKMIGQTSNYSTNNMAFTLSDEFGYRFKLGETREWYIDPQLEIGFGYFNQSDFVQTLGLSSLEGVAESIYTTRARLGSSFGYDFKKFTENKPIKASVYVGAFYEYDYVVGGDVTLTTNLGGETVSSSAISSDGRVVVNVGTNMTIKDNTRIYFDFETSFAGKITTDYQANVGVRYSFGENVGYMPATEVKKESAPLKVSDEKAQENSNSNEKSEATAETNTSSNSKEIKSE